MRFHKHVLVMAGIILVLGQDAQAQYTFVQRAGTYAPFFERNSGDVILSLPADEVLSSWQTLPFPWTFYGESVTGYYASDNGYITFDSLATTSYSANDLPPSVGGPNKAIYGFWDALRLTTVGLADKVQTYTYGSAPARVHVIQWFSVTPSVSSTTMFFAIRLYECGDFDIALTFSNVPSGLSGTVGCENGDGTQATVAGASPNHTGGGGSTTGNTADDIVYHFFYNGQPTLDARMLRANTPHNVEAGGGFDLTGYFQNIGSTTITSFDYSYAVDHGSVSTQSFSGLSIPASGVYSFTHSSPVSGLSAGYHAIQSWISNLNGSPALYTCDDSTTSLFAATTAATGTKRPLMEEFTGAWCGWCPDGKYLLDSLEALHPDVVIASIHAGGGASYAMEIPSGVEIAAAHCPFYPAGSIDRNHYDGEAMVGFTRDLWHSRMADEMLASTPLDLHLETTYDEGARLLDVNVTANFVNYAAGDLRLTVYIVEDSVTGTGTAYNQVNYLNTVVGHPYYGAGNPIIGYVHRHVLRAVPTPTWGDASVIQPQMAPGDTFETTYASIPINASWDADQIHVIAFVSYHDPDPTRRQVLNATEVRMYDGTVIVNVDDPDAHPSQVALIGNFPNPFNPTTEIRYRLAETDQVALRVFNVLGQEVRSLVNGRESGGLKTVLWDGKDNKGNNVSSGVYVYRLEAGGRVFSRKMLLIK